MLDALADRRTFVTRMAAFFGAAALFPTPAAALTAHVDRLDASPGDEAEAWLTALTGKHRQLFHAHDKWNKGIDYATRYKSAYLVEYGVPATSVDSVLAQHGKTGATTYVDAAWEKYEFGKRFDVKDPKTDKLATRNIYREGDSENPGIREALAAGVVVLSCRTALRGLAEWIASENKFGTKEEIERDLTASLIPGVVLVPAMMIAVGRAQEHGCVYMYTG